jgi:hypothetical protein
MPKKKSFHVLLTTTWIVANTAMAQNRPKYAVPYKCTHPGSQFTKKVIPSTLSPRPQQNYCIQTCVHDKITGQVFFFTGMVGQIHVYCEDAGCLRESTQPILILQNKKEEIAFYSPSAAKPPINGVKYKVPTKFDTMLAACGLLMWISVVK